MIETIDQFPVSTKTPRRKSGAARSMTLALERDQAIHDEGIYILMSKRDHVMSHVLVRQRLTDVLPIGKRDAIRDAFVGRIQERRRL